MKKSNPIHRLGAYAHAPKAPPPSPKSGNQAGPSKGQVGDIKAPLIGKSVPPATVSKTKRRPF